MTSTTYCIHDDSIGLQEAQLSQRDCVMLRVIKYLAMSLKVIQGHSK